MSLLNYWHDYIKEKIEKVQSDVDNIEKFKLNKYEVNIPVNGLGSDSETTIDGTILRYTYILGIESVTLSEGVAGNIKIGIDRINTDSNGNTEYVMTITNNTPHVYNGVVTVKLVCLAKA